MIIYADEESKQILIYFVIVKFIRVTYLKVNKTNSSCDNDEVELRQRTEHRTYCMGRETHVSTRWNQTF
jgi:hypothetical protein